MPTRTLKRIWCKTCNEFEIHDTKTFLGKEWFCEKCGTEYSNVFLRDIPEEKLVEQRKRYTNKHRNDTSRLFSSYLLGGGLATMMDSFSRVGYADEIQESDAGQKSIDEENRKLREIEYEKRRVQKQKDLELKQSYHNLGRNEKCLCGSGLKYKKCCWSKIKKI